jgi:hypothetical protein
MPRFEPRPAIATHGAVVIGDLRCVERAQTQYLLGGTIGGCEGGGSSILVYCGASHERDRLLSGSASLAHHYGRKPLPPAVSICGRLEGLAPSYCRQSLQHRPINSY